MSKKSKSAAKERRKSLKRGRKAAEKAKYLAWSIAGANTSKRSKLRNKRALGVVRSKRHKGGSCGNIGCSGCNPADYNLLSCHELASRV